MSETEDAAVLALEDVPTERFPESGIPHRKLTEELGCTDVRVNAVTLEPGQATAAHAHERQEEVYVALDGGRVEIDGEAHDVPPGGVVRVGPEPVRRVMNGSDEARTWLMIGAPPVGTVEDYGEYAMPEG